MEVSNVKTCSLCGRLYSQESRYLRHVRYCRRAQDLRKGRPKSCVACSVSKVKCSFSRPCTRCERKGMSCEYPGDSLGRQPSPRGAYQKEPLRDEIAVTSLTWAQDNVLEGAGLATEGVDEVGGGDGGMHQTDWIGGAWNGFSGAEGVDLGAVGLPMDIPDVDESIRSEVDPQLGLSVVAVLPTSVTNSSSSSSSSPSSKGNSPPTSNPPLLEEYRSRGGFQYMLTPASTPTDLTHLRQGNPVLKHAATLIMHMACSFPQMMLRRATFPPFIHPQWHQQELPDKIAACMGIAQLFVARTPETRTFLWRTIFAEAHRFEAELETASMREVHYAMQALMIYLLMAVVDRDADTPQRGAQLVKIAGMVAFRFRQLVDGEHYSMTERSRPSPTWEDWIVAETRRRMTCLWYLLSRVIAIDVGIPCEGCPPLEDLPLPSSRTLWEARTQEEWAAEKSTYDVGQPITTMMELSVCRAVGDTDFVSIVSAGHYQQPAMSAQQRLLNWEAGGDRLTVMMNIVTEFN